MTEGVDEALKRARQHLHRATLDGLEAARALLDAALRGSGLDDDAAADSLANQGQRSLANLVAGLRENGTFVLPEALAEPLASALDAEIARWERRSQTDADARPVLRAFLGLRELLWEIGMRQGQAPAPPPESPPKPEAQQARPPPRNRVQRFDIGH